MNLGWCDFCLRVNNAGVSREFYENLGFIRVEGDDAEGWTVMVNSETRIGLFQPEFMSIPVSLNFRGGNVLEVCDHLEQRGVTFSKPPKVGKSGGASAELIDPDGHLIFLDSAPGETKKV